MIEPESGMDPCVGDSVLAASALAVDPEGLGGAVLRCRPGPERDAWLAVLGSALPAGTTMRKMPVNTSDDRLIGGIDLAATLATGAPVATRGLLEECDGGVLLVPMAERLSPGNCARLTQSLDSREIVVERDGVSRRAPSRLAVIAIDEGDGPDEAAPAPLMDRLAFHLNLEAAADHDPDSLAIFARRAPATARISSAREALPGVTAGDDVAPALCEAAAVLGIQSLRAPLLAVAAARALAALRGRRDVEAEDVASAARLVLAPRATRLPAPIEQGDTRSNDENSGPDQSPPSQNDAQADADAAGNDARELTEIAIDAAVAALPPGLLDRLATASLRRSRKPTAGRSGAAIRSRTRGRPIESRPGDPGGGARLDVVATVCAAAPWQALRRRDRVFEDRAYLSAQSGALPRLEVRREDFRIARYKHRTETTTIFAVDASGSAALARLGEAKGAVELLLADCYARRDQVALIAFNGRGAHLLLPPTRSLVRAKRCLAGLAGGGGTPLAGGLFAAMLIADDLKRRGIMPIVVVLTDGRANIALDGKPGRRGAEDDALQVGRKLRNAGLAAILIDTGRSATPFSHTLADTMGARFLALPNADSRSVSSVVRQTIAG